MCKIAALSSCFAIPNFKYNPPLPSTVRLPVRVVTAAPPSYGTRTLFRGDSCAAKMSSALRTYLQAGFSVAGLCALAGVGASLGSSLAAATVHVADVNGAQLDRPPAQPVKFRDDNNDCRRGQ